MNQGTTFRYCRAALISALFFVAFSPIASAAPQGRWILPASNISAAGQNADSPQVAVAPNGVATAIWSRFDGAHTIIQAASRTPGGSFGAAVDLSAAGQFSGAPQIAVGADGTAAAAWARFDGAKYIIQAAIRPPGGSFGAAVDLSAPGQEATTPQVAVARNGTVTVIWKRFDGANLIIQAATRLPGGSFSASVDLSAAGQDAEAPQIAISPDGTVTVVWSRVNGVNFVTEAATRPPGGSFGAAVGLSTVGQEAYSPQVASSATGRVTAVWTRFDGTSFRIQAATRPSGGSFGPPVDLSAPGLDATDPQIGYASGGTATVVWTRPDGAHFRIQAATRPPRGPFGTAINLSAAGQSAGAPQIAVAPDGTATVVWIRFNGANTVVQARTRRPGGSFGAAVNLSAPGKDAFSPQVALAPDGSATADWVRFDGGYFIQSASTATARISRVSASGPRRIKTGRSSIFRVRITNSGDAVATGVRIRVFGRGVNARKSVGRIAAGKSRTVRVRLRPKRPGRIRFTFRVTSSNAGGKSVRKSVRVRK